MFFTCFYFQIKVLSSSCPASHVTHRGNVLAWPDFLNGVVGRVKVNLSSIFCAGKRALTPQIMNLMYILYFSDHLFFCRLP